MEGKKMKCLKCQFENREGAKFCKECGAKLELACPDCGTIYFFDSKFCDDCGYDLRKPVKAPVVDYTQPQSYTPKFLADKILTNRSYIEGERKLVTVLFADVANYTSMSEKLDPEEVHQIMDGCFKILLDEIHLYEGTINQFTGDGVMALFGAPVSHEDHAQRACYAALAIQKAIKEYGQKIKETCGVDFLMRIGLNSGPVIVGSIGDNLRMDYTAIGDTTNLAARMQSSSKPGSILLSKETQKLVRDFFEFQSLGKIDVKGKEVQQEAFELVKVSEVETRFSAAVARGLTRFVGRKNSLPAVMSAYDLAKSGSGQVVGMVGEAGVGKSRLLLEFRNRLPQDQFIYFEGRCLHYGDSMVYLPIVEIMRSYFDIKDGDREFVVKKRIDTKVLQLDKGLKNIILPIQELLSVKVQDEAYLQVDPEQRKIWIFEAVRDLLVRESQNKTVVIAIEDLHWIDKTSEEFLSYLIDWLADVKILLILLYRPEYTHHWGSKSHYKRVGLTQLEAKSSAELVQAILEGGRRQPSLCGGTQP
jgi:class 3 adenylate cyclase